MYQTYASIWALVSRLIEILCNDISSFKKLGKSFKEIKGTLKLGFAKLLLLLTHY